MTRQGEKGERETAAGRSRERTTMGNDADGGKENRENRRADARTRGADLSKRQFRNYERGTGLHGATRRPERDRIAFFSLGRARSRLRCARGITLPR